MEMSKRKGQTHRAKPDLAEYKMTPASEVVVRDLEGNVLRTETAQDARAVAQKSTDGKKHFRKK